MIRTRTRSGRSRLALASCAALWVMLVAACGGQDGATANANSPGGAALRPPAEPALAITNFTPASGPAGTEVTVSGTGLNTVSAATLGTASASFRIVSAGELRLTVPAGAGSGRIGVQGGGRAAAAGSDFLVVNPAAVPAVNSITPTTLTLPGQLTLAGSNLDQVANARLANTALAIASQSATQLVLSVPAQATSGTLTLVDRGGTARTLAQTITVQAALAIASFNPTTVARGQTLNIAGQGLDRVSSVRFGGNADTAVASRSGSTALTVVVPAAATSGRVSVLGPGAEQASSSEVLTVYEPIAVTPQTYPVAAGGTVTIAGTGLAQVLGVRVGNADASIASQSATSLAFAVPAGVNCGAITLRSALEAAVNAGTVVVAGGCSVRAAAIELAQVVSQRAGERYQRLASGKETWVRAFVVSSAAGTAAPAVRATGLDASGQALGTITLAGPAALPVLAADAAVPETLRYDGTRSFNAELPAAWVQPGFRVRVSVGEAASPLAEAEAAPLVAASGGLRLVLVPLISGANSPLMPALADVVRELGRKLPVAAGGITVSMRSPYVLTSATSGVSDQAQWSAALSELERLRDLEAPNAVYYGMVRPMVSAGIAGIGYVNSIGSRSPALSALGWDASRTSWVRTMVHELGHNFSRPHAPCGSVAGPDPNYPYANGALGPTPLFDSVANDVLDPGGLADIMGYCRGEWFSDYNLDAVKRFLEARPAAMLDNAGAAFKAQGPVQGGEWLIVSGTVEADGSVTLAPLRTVRGAAGSSAAAGAEGSHTLRLTLADGRSLAWPLQPVPLDHAPGTAHFLLRVPHPGAVIGVQVSRGGKALDVRAPAKASATAAGAAAAGAAGTAGGAGPWAEVLAEGSSIVLRWDAQAWAHASWVLVLPDETRVGLAMEASGGSWRVPVDALGGLPPGGRFEISLSDGPSSVLLVVPRP